MKEIINNIHCLALNYKGIGENIEPPLYFLKSKSTLTEDNGSVPFPIFMSGDVWTEVELAIMISKSGFNIKTEDASQYIKGFFVAGDITCSNICNRDHHLAMGKSRQGFCPIGSFIGVNNVKNVNNLKMTTSINGVVRQEGNTNQMKYNPYECISFISNIVELQENDIILTGTCSTPNGGPQFDCLVKKGDKIEHSIENIGKIRYDFN